LSAGTITSVIHHGGRTATAVPAALAVAAVVGALILNRVGRRRGAFMLSGAMIVLVTATLFGALYPDVLPSTTDAATSLTVDNARSTTYTLTIMTWVAGRLPPARPGLPGLDLLGLPAPCQRRRRPGRAGSGPGERPVSSAAGVAVRLGG
jgi:hypothetical protein